MYKSGHERQPSAIIVYMCDIGVDCGSGSKVTVVTLVSLVIVMSSFWIFGSFSYIQLVIGEVNIKDNVVSYYYNIMLRTYMVINMKFEYIYQRG